MAEPVRVSYALNAKNALAQKAAAEHAARMVREVAEETREALRQLVARSIREGIPPAEAAKLIRSLVGLTSRQANAAMNYRTQLQASGISSVGAVERYVEKLRRRRAATIARTEVIGALNRGRLEAWMAAIAKGLLSPDAWVKWVATPDDGRTCPICSALHGDAVPIGSAFDGGFLAPPAHPQCRCALVLLPRGDPEKAARAPQATIGARAAGLTFRSAGVLRLRR